MKRILRVVCLLVGHRYETETFDGRGRRVRLEKCGRCGDIDFDRMVVTPLNRQVRRRWARDAARRIARV